MSSSAENRLVKKAGSKNFLLEDTIVATPVPRASSTVDKFKMKPCYGGIESMERKKPEELALQQRRAAVVEVGKKLDSAKLGIGSDSACIWSEEQPLTAPTNSASLFSTDHTTLNGSSISGICDPSFLKKETIMEESGFTNLQNVSDLEKEEQKRLENWDFIPTSQVEISFPVNNSRINPPDFMPVEDSLFSELQGNDGIRYQVASSNTGTKTKHSAKELAEQLSLLKHDISQSSRDTPTIEELSLAFKSCKNHDDPRKIMDQVLKYGKNKAKLPAVNTKTEVLGVVKPYSGPLSAEQLSSSDITQSSKDTPSIEELSLAFKSCKNHDDPRKIMDQLLKSGKTKAKLPTLEMRTAEVSEAVKPCSALSKYTPVTFEDSLIWGNVEIGESKIKALHVIHNQEKPDNYRFSIEGNNGFKIILNSPNKYSAASSSVCSHAFSYMKYKSCYELLISFQPHMVGQASGYIVIESDSYKTSKKVCLNAFGGRSKMLFHGITFDPLSNDHSIILNNTLQHTFKLENCGSSQLYFYLSAGFMDRYYEIQPKLGHIEARSHVLVHIKLILEDYIHFESLSSFQETYLDVGCLMIYFGDESTRLRLNNLISRHRDDDINYLLDNYPFLTCKSFPSSAIDISLDDPKANFSQLVNDGTNRMEICLQVGRKDLFHGLENKNSKYQPLLKSQELIVKLPEP